jgi:hypothetical protein
MSETAYNNWIHQQLEPEDILPRHKHDVRPYTASQLVRVYQDEIITLQQEEEDNARQDAYLAKHGIY